MEDRIMDILGWVIMVALTFLVTVFILVNLVPMLVRTFLSIFSIAAGM